MRTEDLIDIDNEMLEQIKKQTLDLAKLKEMDTEILIEDLKVDFKRTLNSIIFDENIIGLEVPFNISDIKNYRKKQIEKI